ncbi:ATP-dependent DNA helicase PIF1 [Colletotrichum simmondsii]|uniref:ATP-dependent DNA helicase n=1 Tax=Colletotrichum simmondsii TaxID=703756 RepID=A0A135S024_9PEZI|nr:ATP-dependent DNA helicase PIF1 [Colletotrichum simmondsii]
MRKYTSGIPKELSGAEKYYVPQPQPTPQNTHGSTPQYTTAASSSPKPGNAAPSNVAAAVAGTGEPQAHSFEPVPDPCEPPLCPEQQAAMDLAMAGHNLFITGSGGCGKSVLVKALHQMFKARQQQVHLIAPTGIAAVNINGRTTWNYAGWIPKHLTLPFDDLIEKSRATKTWKRLIDTNVLIIDEISMVENQFFERLGRVMSFLRREEAQRNPQRHLEVLGAFGGVQVICVGDFCQLPPVNPFKNCMICGKKMEKEKAGRSILSYSCPEGHPEQRTEDNPHGSFRESDKWAFKATEWERCNFKYVHLKEVHRQTDKKFIRILQTCRLGKDLSPEDMDLLLNHPSQVDNATRLFSRRWQADDLNTTQLSQLSTESHNYWGLDSVSPNGNQDEGQEPLDDKYTIDLANGLCNGSQGEICGFVPRSRIDCGSEPQRKNYKNDVSGYEVARERFHRTEQFMTEEGAPDFYPEVQFNNGQRRVVGPDCTVNELGTKQPYMLISRTQVPLAPGWAMTIHKSQSLSLDRLIIDLGSVFEKGQAYVALSRARSLQGLKIEGTNESMLQSGLKLDSEVRRFLEELERSSEGN